MTEEECSRHRGQRETDREIKAIRQLIANLNTNSEVNKTNLENVTNTCRDLASTNNIAHYELFARAESLGINLKELETKHIEHIKHGSKESINKHHRVTVLISWIAISISVVTVSVLIVQALLMK